MPYRRQGENGLNTYDPMESGRNPGKISMDVEPIGKIGRCPQMASSTAPSFLFWKGSNFGEKNHWLFFASESRIS